MNSHEREKAVYSTLFAQEMRQTERLPRLPGAKPGIEASILISNEQERRRIGVHIRLNTLGIGAYVTPLGIIGVRDLAISPVEQHPYVVIDTAYCTYDQLKKGEMTKTVYLNHRTGSGRLHLPKDNLLIVDIGGPTRPEGVSLRQAQMILSSGRYLGGSHYVLRGVLRMMSRESSF